MSLLRRVLVVVLVVGSACGVLDAVAVQGDPCGVLRCGVGEYCLDQEFGTCAPGCRADDHCSAWESCEVPEGEVVGECVESRPPTERGAQDPGVAACVEACDAYGFFGCPGTDVAGCGERCAGASVEAASEFITCADATFCNYGECRDLLH